MVHLKDFEIIWKLCYDSFGKSKKELAKTLNQVRQIAKGYEVKEWGLEDWVINRKAIKQWEQSSGRSRTLGS